ncbi:RNase P/RNase MRP subunit p29 [Thermoplasmatales archaeon SW_10_69_26]|jgi:ribonuclease P protein subunit POP4|nr:MAG: RNase P/RNase MRP subunit p29 [Thermoplasmatales archaeon SW_10_69_26]
MQRSGDALARCLARGRLIGREVRITSSDDPSLTGTTGEIVDETKNTLTLQSGSSRRIVGKPGQQFAFPLEDREVLLDGNEIAHRPEDRVKKAKVDR